MHAHHDVTFHAPQQAHGSWRLRSMRAYTHTRRLCVPCRLLLKDDKGLLSKESARSVIDGSVFQKLAEEREKRLQRRRVRTLASCSLLHNKQRAHNAQQGA
jgi:Caleosin related protein